MVLRSFLLSVALAVVCTAAQAQIVINYSDMVAYFGLGITEKAQTGTPAPIDVGTANSPNAQTFDFTGITFAAPTDVAYVDPATTPFAANFPLATFAFQSTSLGPLSWAYIQMNPSGVNLLGFENDTMRQKLRTPLEIYPFPLTTGAAWAPPGSRGDSVTINVPGVGALRVPVSIQQKGSCDAWGTLKTSRGSWPCLRVTLTRIITGVVPVLGQTQLSKTISYEFHTKVGEEVVTDIDTGDVAKSQLTPLTITYNHLPAIPAGVAETTTPNSVLLANAYPNPAQSMTTLQYALTERSAVTAELVNMLGATISTIVTGTQPAGVHSAAINLAGLPPGSYMCRLTVNGHTSATPVIVAK